ncbi:pilin [Aquifex aeolicus]|uniref:Minor pilin n=1 Tax=Aquifex aeolicus (strain VF5) TaxID=224324 RepID=O67424_AQUAE|nr:pilin [Aquifex aeolicus]AAC07382.1 minor pilin [Aquifex aeolicus VF5]
MPKEGGFTLVEVLVALMIVLVLAGLAIPLYEITFKRNAMRAVVLSDLRQCLSIISVHMSTGGNSPSEVLGECPKSDYTQEIRLLSDNPITIEAVGRSDVGEVRCTYDGNTGEISCDSTF